MRPCGVKCSEDGVVLHGNNLLRLHIHGNGPFRSTTALHCTALHCTADAQSWCSRLAMDVGEGQKKTSNRAGLLAMTNKPATGIGHTLSASACCRIQAHQKL
jgi:hypothetical protein